MKLPEARVGAPEARPIGIAALRRALADDRRSVTSTLEDRVGELLLADVVGWHEGGSGPDDELRIVGDPPLTRRAVVLRGRTSGLAYVYAESTFAPGRIPRAVLHRLEESDDPIGRVLVTQGLEAVREPLLDGHAVGEPKDLDHLPSTSVWSRSYRLTAAGEPLFAIREWFLQPVLDALVGVGTGMPANRN